MNVCDHRSGALLAILLAAASTATVGPRAVADELHADPSTYRELLARLRPGDTLLLGSGTYRRGLSLRHVAGTAADPIVISGPADRSATFLADDCCNTVQLESVAFIEIRNLTLDGAGTNRSFGVDSRGPCHDVTIENLKIVHYGANQQVVGISTKGPAWNWVIRRNEIVAAGTGMYLGNSDGTAPFVNGRVEHNLIVGSTGYAIQIKHQVERPLNIGLPAGASSTLIRHNVLGKQGAGDAGRDARPTLLVGHFPLLGPGAQDRYEIYGNFLYENPHEALFQGEGNLVLHDNLFVSSTGDAIRVVEHHARPRAVAVFHNTVVAAGRGILVEDAEPGYPRLIAANAVFSGQPITGPAQFANVTGGYASAAQFLAEPLGPLGRLDLYPRPGGMRLGAVRLELPAGLVDATFDFDGRLRRESYAGAYAGEGTNPGWRLALRVKPGIPPVNPAGALH